MADNNVNEMKLAKFESFVQNIVNKLNFKEAVSDKEGRVWWFYFPIDRIFGTTKNNGYSRKIDFCFSAGIGDFDEYVKNLDAWYIMEFEIRIKYFKAVKTDHDTAIANIFAALMSLAVDRTDYEERLSTVCDVAVMLDISDDEMADIVQAVRFVYRDIKADDVDLKTESCQKFFKKLIPSQVKKSYLSGGVEYAI